MAVELQVIGEVPRTAPRRTLQQAAQHMLEWLSLPHAELSLVLCDDATMQALNRRHRAIDKPTDVLAFPTLDADRRRSSMRVGPMQDGEAPWLLGDIVLSAPISRRQALTSDHSWLAELTMLTAHGLLHLLGLDHRDAAETRRMQARTDLLRHAAGGGQRSGHR